MEVYPLVNQQKTIDNGPVEIVDLPMKNRDFPVRFVSMFTRPGMLFEILWMDRIFTPKPLRHMHVFAYSEYPLVN